MDFKHNFKKYGILSVRPPPSPPVWKIPYFFFLFFLRLPLSWFIFMYHPELSSAGQVQVERERHVVCAAQWVKLREVP